MTVADGVVAGGAVGAVGDDVPAIVTDGLAKAYGDAVALAPTDLSIRAGEHVALIGHNGSGKTTLLRLLCGLLEPSAGRAAILGSPAGSLAARAAVSYLADEPVFYDDLSLHEHLRYVAGLHRTDGWEEHADFLLDALRLHDRVDDLPSTFSRGLRQRAAIALAFVRPFDVLLVDEPFVGLDPPSRSALVGLIEWAHGDGATVVVATHELGYVDEVERVVELRDGSVVGDPIRDPIGDVVGDADRDPVGDAGHDLGDGDGPHERVTGDR